MPEPLVSSNSSSNHISIHGPYEDVLIAGFHLLEKVIEGQDPATKAELWKRHLEVTKPLHEVAVQAASQIADWIKQLKSLGS
jgi:hypothetical protein